MTKDFIIGLTLLASISVHAQVYNAGNDIRLMGISNNGIAAGDTMGDTHVVWSENGGTVNIGTLTSGMEIGGRTTVSADGRYVATTMTNPETNLDEMARYDRNSGKWDFLGGLTTVIDNSISSAWHISSDGKTVVGLGWHQDGTAHAIKWTEAAGIVDMGSTSPGNSSRANAANADGSVIVGWQDNDTERNGVYWKNGAQTALTYDDGFPLGEAGAVTPDGKTIVGDTEGVPYIWKDGVVTEIQPSSPMMVGSVTGITDDGKTVVGFFRPWGAPAAMGQGYIRTEGNGLIDLNEYVESLGYSDQGITFALPLGISPNGQYIAGIGMKDDWPVGFVIKLPESTMATAETVKATRIAVYPNPVKDVLNLTANGKVTSIEVFNTAGQKVWTQNGDAKQIDLSRLPAGSYVLTVTIDGKKQSTKFIKK